MLDKAIFLADAKRLQDLHPARGIGTALFRRAHPYRKGEQFSPEFLKISPNNQDSRIVDRMVRGKPYDCSNPRPL